MTDNERFQIVGRVVSEHEAAKRHLAVLKAKGKTTAEFLAAMGRALSDEGAWRVETTGFTVQRCGGSGGPVSGEWPTVDAVTALLQEIADTKARIVSLDAQRKELGV